MENDSIKRLEVEIKIDGTPLQGTSTIVIKDGIVDYSLAEEHLYEIIRKWEKDWIKEWQEEYKESIIDNLTAEQEDKLRDAHAKDYHGTDDDMPDDYEGWLMEQDYQDLKEILK